MGCCGRKKLLMFSTSLFISTSFVFLCMGITTDYWLYARERMSKETADNHTFTESYSGLWRTCQRTVIQIEKSEDALKSRWSCKYIKYINWTDDKSDLTKKDSILYDMRRSSVFPLVSLLFMIVGGIMCFAGNCNNTRKVLTFLGGVLFILAGLTTLIGLILFIGVVTDATTGNKKDLSLENPRFVYSYGSSFIMISAAFGLMELSGVVSIYLYISRHKAAYRKKQERRRLTQTSSRRENGGQLADMPIQNDQNLSPSYECYYTYSPVETEISNYALVKEVSPNRTATADTCATQSNTTLLREPFSHSATSRRTTPV